LKEEAQDCTVWRTCFGRGFGPVVRQTTEWMNEWKLCTIGTAAYLEQSVLVPVCPN
jgi:hypothetical protein